MSDPTIFVVDDDEAMRHSLTWLLETLRHPIETFSDAEAFLRAYDGRPGCLMLDVRMPGMSGLELQQRLVERSAPLQVILLTAHGDVPMAVRAMHAGAFDFVQKPYNGQALLERVEAAVRAARRRDEHEQQRAGLRRRLDSLTPREREVLEQVAGGEPNKRIAQLLGVSLRTVEVHRHHVMEKLEAHTVGELIRIYLAADDKPE